MRKRRGFTLLELMAVVTIIGILAAIAMVQYSKYLVKSRRQDGRSKILEVAQREERYFSENNAYTNDVTAMGYASPLSSDQGYYVITVTVAASVTGGSNDSYAITATTAGVQTGDSYCANLTYTSLNVRGATGTGGAACW